MINALYWIWLTERVTDSACAELLERFGNAENIYNETKFDGIADRRIINALNDKNTDNAESILDTCRRKNIFAVAYDSPDYPELLRHIPDPPYVLYMKGNLFDWNSFIGIGVVGTRKCNEYGISVTELFARGLAENDIVIVSGLAEGIDSVAARTAFEVGKPSIAVLGCGVDVVYPAKNESLYRCVENTGLIISEYPPGRKVTRFSFPRRNRIISGLSKGVLITQAPKHSGALITAKHAAEQGRDVFAVPGDIFEFNCIGSNKLIADGAIPVTDVDGILREYPEYANKKPTIIRKYAPIDTKSEEKPSVNFDALTQIQQSICTCISDGKNHIDEIAREINVSVSTLNNELLMMELADIVTGLPGNRYKLKD